MKYVFLSSIIQKRHDNLCHATQKTEKPIRGVSGQHRLNNRVWFYKNFQSLLRPRVPYIINIAEGSILGHPGGKKF